MKCSLISVDPCLVQVLTRDSVTVTVDAVVYYRVSNPTMVQSAGNLSVSSLLNCAGNKQCRRLRSLHPSAGRNHIKVKSDLVFGLLTIN